MARSCKDCIKVGVCEIYDIVQYNGHAIGCGSFIDTADVVPKSEFEKLQEAYNNRLAKDIQTNADFVRYAQAEVAREIFEDLEMYVEEHDGCSVNLSRCEFAELKKKYTGDQT